MKTQLNRPTKERDIWQSLKPHTRKTLGFAHVSFCLSAGIVPTVNRQRLVLSARDFPAAVAYSDLLAHMKKSLS